MRRGLTWPWIRMGPLLARFSEPVWSGHLPSWADFITTTPELKFSVHTGPVVDSRRVSDKRTGYRQVHHSWAYTGERARPAPVSTEHRYGRLRDRPAHLAPPRGR